VAPVGHVPSTYYYLLCKMLMFINVRYDTCLLWGYVSTFEEARTNKSQGSLLGDNNMTHT
jgi:hypothetical protein